MKFSNYWPRLFSWLSPQKLPHWKAAGLCCPGSHSLTHLLEGKKQLTRSPLRFHTHPGLFLLHTLRTPRDGHHCTPDNGKEEVFMAFFSLCVSIFKDVRLLVCFIVNQLWGFGGGKDRDGWYISAKKLSAKGSSGDWVPCPSPFSPVTSRPQVQRRLLIKSCWKDVQWWKLRQLHCPMRVPEYSFLKRSQPPRMASFLWQRYLQDEVLDSSYWGAQISAELPFIGIIRLYHVIDSQHRNFRYFLNSNRKAKSLWVSLHSETEGGNWSH